MNLSRRELQMHVLAEVEGQRFGLGWCVSLGVWQMLEENSSSVQRGTALIERGRLSLKY